MKDGKAQTFKDLRAVIFITGLVLGGAFGLWWGRSHPRVADPTPHTQTESTTPPTQSQELANVEKKIQGKSDLIEVASVVSDYATRCLAACRLGDIAERRKQLSDLLISWVRVEPELAYRFAVTQAPLVDRDFVISMVLNEWARRDPGTVLALAQDLTGRLGLVKAWNMIVDATGQVAPFETLRAVDGLSSAQLKEDLMPRLAEQCGELDPQRTLAWAKALPNARFKSRVLADVFEGWAKRDPRGAAQEAISLPGGETRGEVLGSVGRMFSATDPYAAMAWFEQLPRGRERDRTWNGIIAGLSHYLEALPPSTLLAEGKRLLALDLEPDRRRAVYERVASNFAANDPAAARAWIMELPPGEERSVAFASMMRSWTENDPAEALRFVMANPTLAAGPDAGRMDVAELASKWAEQDPEAALRFVRAVPEERHRQRMMLGLVDGLRNENPAMAAALIGELPSDEAQAQAASHMARGWAFNDPAGTAAWMNTLPGGATRDAAIHAFVSSVDGYDISLANQWAATIDDFQQRLDVSGQVFERWLREDQASARQWLNDQELDAALKSHLQALTQRPKE